MITTNGIRAPYGKLDASEGGMVIRYVFNFGTGPIQEYQGVSGDGSARNVHEMQTIFVDNGANASAVRISCYGTGHTFTVPANSQGFFPIFCADNAFGISIAATTGAADIPITLIQKPMDIAVWKVN